MRKINKESLVCIIKTKKRFISILLIVLLGVGFFGGIKATSPDMEDTLDKYYSDTNFMDFNIKSTWGIDEEFLSYYKDYNIEVGYSVDAIVELDTEKVAKVLSYNKYTKINDVFLVEGRLPVKNDECIVDSNSGLKIGQSIKVKDTFLKEVELKVVGLVTSPLYSSIEKGSTNLLNGSISLFIYVLEDKSSP